MEGAYSKFTGGRGNVIRQAEMLKELGVKPTKHFPQNLIDSALAEPLSGNIRKSNEEIR